MRRVLILGAGGQLGRKVSEVFTARQWQTFGADVSLVQVALKHPILLERAATPEAHNQAILSHLREKLSGDQLDAVVNVAGGFTMGNAADPGVITGTRAMVESSLYTSVHAASAAAAHLRPGGLLILPGAFAAFGPTAWSLPYGVAKTAVHHLVRSLADVETAGMPAGSRTIGIAPKTLDTQQNREAMPDADRSTWATLDEVAQQLEVWSADPSSVVSGKVYVINKDAGRPAVFEPREPL